MIESSFYSKASAESKDSISKNSRQKSKTIWFCLFCMRIFPTFLQGRNKTYYILNCGCSELYSILFNYTDVFLYSDCLTFLLRVYINLFYTVHCGTAKPQFLTAKVLLCKMTVTAQNCLWELLSSSLWLLIRTVKIWTVWLFWFFMP